ncbi:hypothetical protein V8F20_008969 [Naviculisporaceae sp. PSN 640]
MTSFDEGAEKYDFYSLQTITLSNSTTKPATTASEDCEFESIRFTGSDFHRHKEGDAQPDGILDEDIGNGALTLKCDITTVVNGTLSRNGHPATLIVFQFAFLARGNNHRFKSVEITITFSSGKIRSISPDNEWATLPSEKVQEISHTVSPSLEAAFGPVKAATFYAWQHKETQTLRGYAKVTGMIRSTGHHSRGKRRKKEKNSVIWGLYEDPQARPRTGIPSFLQSAVLVEREATIDSPFGERFSASIHIHGNVDSASEARNKLVNAGKWMTGRTRKGNDIWFPPDPRMNKGTARHPDNLQDEDLNSYRQLIAIRPWESDDTASVPKEDGTLVNSPDSEDPIPDGTKTVATPTNVSTGPVADPQGPTATSNAALPGKEYPRQLPSLGGPAPMPIPVKSQGEGGWRRWRRDTANARKKGRSLTETLSDSSTSSEEDDSDVESASEDGDSDRYYEEQLRLVRAERKWSERIVKLLAEERRLVTLLR